MSDLDYINTCVPGQYAKKVEYDPRMYSMFPSPHLPPPIPAWEIALKITFYVIAFLVDIIGNSLVVLIIILNRKMRNTTNFLILNLAVSDLMVGIFCMWVHTGNRVTNEWPFDETVCKSSIFFQVLAVTSSVLTLTAISVERFFAIVFPLKSLFTPLVSRIVVLLIWIVSVTMGTPYLIIMSRNEFYWSNRHEVWCQENWPKIYTDSNCNTKEVWRVAYYTVSGVVMFFVPVVVMVAAYSIIVIKMLLRRMPGSRVTSNAMAQERSRRKVVRMLIIVLVAFVVCWTPQQVLLLWDVYRPRDWPNPPNIEVVKYIALYIAYLSSAINPVLYGGFNENFRRGFHEAFEGRLWKKRNAIVPTSRVNAGSNTTAVDASRSRAEGQPSTSRNSPVAGPLPAEQA